MDEKELAKKKNKASKILKDAKAFLERSNIDENMTLHDFYEAIGTSEEEYLEALKISERGYGCLGDVEIVWPVSTTKKVFGAQRW